MLIGETDRTQLFYDYPEWKTEYETYQPDQKDIAFLAKSKKDVRVDVFFGTWCKDSRRDVPRFLKILDLSHFTNENYIKLWAVNREKKLDSDLAQRENIQRVATFIFKRNNKEIGRIIEFPDETLEKDMRIILEKN